MIVAVLLAAGSSRRWGAGNKLFARVAGDTILGRSLDAAAAASRDRPIVVTGWQHARLAHAVRRQAPAARIVRARNHREGLGASLRAAAAALRPIDTAMLLFLADMPWAQAGRLARRSGALVRPSWRGTPGHPVLLRGPALAALASARGDAGPGRGLSATLVPDGRRCIADVDRPGTARTRPPRLR